MLRQQQQIKLFQKRKHEEWWSESFEESSKSEVESRRWIGCAIQPYAINDDIYSPVLYLLPSRSGKQIKFGVVNLNTKENCDN